MSLDFLIKMISVGFCLIKVSTAKLKFIFLFADLYAAKKTVKERFSSPFLYGARGHQRFSTSLSDVTANISKTDWENGLTGSTNRCYEVMMRYKGTKCFQVLIYWVGYRCSSDIILKVFILKTEGKGRLTPKYNWKLVDCFFVADCCPPWEMVLLEISAS